jgi:hypothetical protein
MGSPNDNVTAVPVIVAVPDRVSADRSVVVPWTVQTKAIALASAAR